MTVFKRARNLSTLGLILLTVAGMSGCGDATSSAPEPAAASTAVSVEIARSESIPSFVQATGSVAAWQELVVSAETGGVSLQEVLVEESDLVREGQLLGRLDSATLRTDVAKQEAAVREAEASFAKAETEQARKAGLATRGAAPRTEAEEAATAAQTSRAQLDQARAALKRLQIQLRQMDIIAPAAGRISAKPAVIGTIVQTGTELFRIIRDDRLEVNTEVPEQYLGSVRPGQGAKVIDSAGGVLTAEVRAIAATVHPETRLAVVYVALPSDTTLKPGMFARVSITTEATSKITVPEASIVWRDGKPHVFTVDAAGTAGLRLVETEARQNGRVAVRTGIAAGERVVVAGAPFLNDGSAVRVSVAQAGVDGARQ